MNPTEPLQAVIQGRLSSQEAPEWTRAGVSMATYQHARHVLSQSTREARRAALERVPVGIKEGVERGAKKVVARAPPVNDISPPPFRYRKFTKPDIPAALCRKTATF